MNDRRMWRIRIALLATGVLTPYLARVPGMFEHGSSWLTSYVSSGIGGFAAIQSFNSLVWGSLYAASLFVRKPSPLVLPSIAGLGFVGVAHSGVDLTHGARAAVALAFIPIYALPIIGGTFLLSILVLGRGPGPHNRVTPSDFRDIGDRSDHRAPGPPVPRKDSGFACFACGNAVNFGASQCSACEQIFRYSPRPRHDSVGGS
jgi:hypothetical protein